MTPSGRADRRRIERRLPRRYRGRSGYRQLLLDATLRVSVSGIRGKSYLTETAMQALQERGLSVYAKQTGTRPVSYKNGVAHPIERDPRKKAVLSETYWEVKRHWPVDAIVLENQGITPYTMRVFNTLYARPHYLLITNIRRDHLGDIARTLPRMAVAFVRSAPKGTTLISGERDHAIKRVMRKTAKSRGIRFIDAAPGRHVVPGFESVTVLDAMLKDWMGEGLTPKEKRDILHDLEGAFRWRLSAIPGVRWFPGGEINDVDSTAIVLDHLQRQERLPTTLIGYLRRDRGDRTASFIPFLRDVFQQGKVDQVYLCGHGAPTLRRRLSPWKDRIHVVPEDDEAIGAILDELEADDCKRAVMTIINAVPPWPTELAKRLDVDADRAQLMEMREVGPTPLLPFRPVPTGAERTARGVGAGW